MSGSRRVTISSEPMAPDSDAERVREGLALFNVARTGQDFWRYVRLFVRDETGLIRGGLLGAVWGGWLHVTDLWLEESLRGSGLGRKLWKRLELLPASFNDFLAQRRLEVGEELKRRARGPFLTHEEERCHRCGQQQRRRGPPLGRANRVVKTIAQRAIAYLIVVLDRDDRLAHGHVRWIGAARTLVMR